MKTTEKKDPFLKTLDVTGNVYEEFVPDQVLTHKNLNKIVNYFEDQDRLTRIHLNGVGIGGGLNIVSFDKSKIIIGQGFGLTTDGDLIKIETSEFLYYTELADKADYALFKDLEVFEIHTQEGAGHLTGELPLSSLPNLSEHIVVAYVENYTEDEGLCTGFGCDDSGNKVYANIKFLLIHEDSYDDLIADDTIYNSHNVLVYYDDLPDLCIQRLLLNSKNTRSITSIHNQFKNSFYLNDLSIDLNVAIATILDKLNHRLNFAKFGITASNTTQLFGKLFKSSVGYDIAVQYKYDLLKDLLETYKQIRDLLLHIHFECVPAIGAFPKHLMLGTLAESTRVETRHQFYPSPITTGNDENLDAIRTLIIKFHNQLQQYKIPNIGSAKIKVTPSKSYEYDLSERAIPYYYETKKNLVRAWSPKSISIRKPLNQLGYHVHNLKNIPCVQSPLKYTHLDKNFYRIEGHLGKDFKIALNKINTIKRESNLAFDVKAVSINFPVSKLSLDDDKCDTKSYSILLQTWEQEFCCTAESAIAFFSEYDYADIGGNATKPGGKPNGGLTKPGSGGGGKPANGGNGKPVNGKGSKSNEELMFGGQGTLGEILLLAGRTLDKSDRSAAKMRNLAIDYYNESKPKPGTGEQPVSSEDLFFYIENPINIITDLLELKKLFITELNSIYNTQSYSKFLSALDKLDTDLKKAIFALSKITKNSSFGSNIHDKMYEYFIYELKKLGCVKGRFEWMKGELNEIKYNLYKDLILSELIKSHPGLEHMAGVPKGGTFLLVYQGAGFGDETEEEFPEMPANMEDKDDDDFDGPGGFFKHKRGKKQYDGTVLFDFALPYLCCTDCAPGMVVYQTEVPISLAIEPKVYCYTEGDGIGTSPFIVTPSGSKLASSEGVDFIEGNVSGYTFNPSKVPNNLLGEELTFTVNDVKIDYITLKTYMLPKEVIVSFEVKEWNEDGLVVDLFATHGLEDKSYFNYYWKRPTGEPLGTSKDMTNVLIRNPEDDINETITLVVSINDEQAACTVSETLLITEARPKIIVDLSLKPRVYCFNEDEDPGTVPFTVTPSDGVVSSPQGKVFITGGVGSYVFNPLKVSNALLGQPISFKVNDEVIEKLPALVFKLPKEIVVGYTVIGWEEKGLKIELTSTHILESQKYFNYSWTRKGGTPLGNEKDLTNIIIPDTEGSISENLQLTIGINDEEAPCLAVKALLVTEERPVEPVGLVIEPKVYCIKEGNTAITTDFTVAPNGGELQSPQGTVFIEGTKGDYHFNPNNVPTNLLGKPITFTVNGETIAGSDLRVYKVPKTSSVIQSNLIWKEGKLFMTFEADLGSFVPQSYLIYTWTNDKNTLNEVNSKLTGKFSTSFDAPNDVYTDNITLRISVNNKGAACTSSAKHTVEEVNRRLDSPDVVGGTIVDGGATLEGGTTIDSGNLEINTDSGTPATGTTVNGGTLTGSATTIEGGTITIDEGAITSNIAGCEISFAERLNKYSVKNFIIKLALDLDGQIFEESYLKNVLSPAKSEIAVLESASSAEMFDVGFLNKHLGIIENLRNNNNAFITDEGNKEFQARFAAMAEILEVIGLELLRCIVEEIAKSIIESVQTFFISSTKMTDIFNRMDRQRTMVNSTYIKNYISSKVVAEQFNKVFKIG